MPTALSRSEAQVQAWWQVTQALETAHRPEQVIQAVVQTAVQMLGARGGAVALPTADGQSLEVRGFAGYDPEAFTPWHVLPLDRHSPSTAAFQHQAPFFIEDRHQGLVDYPALAETLQEFAGSVVALPLMVEAQALGVLTLSFNHQRRFDASDRVFLRSLAGQCAQALQRSTALNQAETLNDQLAYLARASEVLSRSLSLDETLDSIARLLVPRLTDWCAIHLPSPDRQHLIPVTVVHQDEEMVSFLRDFIGRHPVETAADNGSGRVFRSGLPELIPVITDEMYDALPQSEAWKAEVRRLQLRSVINVPMHANGRVVGVLGLARTSLDRTYRQEDVAFALEVARRAGSAVENAHLYTRAQQEIRERQRAQQELDMLNASLEERVRARTEDLVEVNRELEAFTYSASHDLRTPIRHVMSFADLARAALQTTPNEKVSRHLDVIQKSALRMNALIDGMLVLSNVGRQAFCPQMVNLETLVLQARRDVGLEFPGRSIRWTGTALPFIWGDPSMLQQVMTNLMSNAVKYSQTREVSEVSIAVEEQERAWVVSVRDNGIGFDPAYAGRLFGMFQRLHSEREFEGTGVGLATVRRIVSRHQGQVFAESPDDTGATFGFQLPKPEPSAPSREG